MGLKKLNKTQKSAVQATKGPVLIFAGAGSGKTRVLTHKIYHLINEKLYKPENIMAVTFTNKAAQEMKARIGKLLNAPNLNIAIGTFHSICARILRKHIHHLGYTNKFAIYDRTDQIDILKITLDKLNISKSKLTPKGIVSQISLVKNQMITQTELLQKARTNAEKTFAEVYPAYQKELKENNAVDFDDLLLLPLKLFENKPEILAHYQKKWQYVLVDEYQDTNLPQFLLVSKIAEKHKQICVVGDDDQSIYGWRGANIRNILDFEQVFPDCTVFTLEKNYRSTQKILDAASIVVKNNVNRAAKELYSVHGKGEKLGFIRTVNELEEADAVVSALEKEIKLNKRNFSDFAVLYRVNAQSRALEDSFRRMGIPYNIVGGIRFYERKEIKDMLSYLRLILNLKDTISLRRVVNFPPRGIGLKTVNKCIQKAEETGRGLLDIIGNQSGIAFRSKQADALENFYNIIIKYHKLVDKLDARELVAALSEEIGILSYFKDSQDADEMERYRNIRELLNSVDAYIARNPAGGLSGFLEEVSLLTDIDSWNDEENRVTLMTLHSAKGLEFPVVFITGLEDGLFPWYSALDNRKELEEERRLFYVGLTRAMERVYLLYATNRRRMGNDYNLGMMSRFLREIPEKYLEEIPFSSVLTHKVISTKPGSVKVRRTRTVTTFDDFKVGDSVEHVIFGVGEIKAISGSGENQRVGVAFKDGLKKKLIVKFANLKKIE